MANAIRRNAWLAIEESLARDTWWEMIVWDLIPNEVYRFYGWVFEPSSRRPAATAYLRDGRPSHSVQLRDA